MPGAAHPVRGQRYSPPPALGISAGIVDETALVFGTETAFKVAVDASQGESLAESEEYTDRIRIDLPDDAPRVVLLRARGRRSRRRSRPRNLGPAEAQMIGPAARRPALPADRRDP